MPLLLLDVTVPIRGIRKAHYDPPLKVKISFSPSARCTQDNALLPQVAPPQVPIKYCHRLLI